MLGFILRDDAPDNMSVFSTGRRYMSFERASVVADQQGEGGLHKLVHALISDEYQLCFAVCIVIFPIIGIVLGQIRTLKVRDLRIR